MIEKVRKVSYDNRGSALIMALVVSAVLMVLSLSLLAVSYSFFISQKNNTGGINEREMFYSAVEIFEQELMNGKHKVFDTNVSPETIAQNMDDQLFGTQVIDSIFKYCSVGMETIGADDIESWENFDLENYYEFDEDGRINYIDSVSRYFDLTSFGSYQFRIQIYWEFDNSKTETVETELDKMDGILLHAIYYLKKGEETLIKNERVYRLNTSMGSSLIEKPNDENNNDTPGGENNTESKTYWIKFGVIKNLENFNSYLVSHEFFPGMKWDNNEHKYPYIEISAAEKDSTDFDVLQEYSDILENFNTIWYTSSDKKEEWKGTPYQIFTAQGTSGDTRTARTDWGGAVPVRIKFVINGNYVDLNIYDFCYVHYVGGETGSQKFTKKELNNMITDAMLEVCDIEITDTDNHNNIIWKYKYNNDNSNNFFNLFQDDVLDPDDDEIAEPYIEEDHFTRLPDKDNPIFYVFATFPSNYNDDGTLKSDVTIPKYVENKIISSDDVCSYKKYYFERVIGQ